MPGLLFPDVLKEAQRIVFEIFPSQSLVNAALGMRQLPGYGLSYQQLGTGEVKLTETAENGFYRAINIYATSVATVSLKDFSQVGELEIARDGRAFDIRGKLVTGLLVEVLGELAKGIIDNTQVEGLNEAKKEVMSLLKSGVSHAYLGYSNLGQLSVMSKTIPLSLI